jgi:hypothetical protein
MLNPICAQRLVDPLGPVPNQQRQPSLAAYEAAAREK